MDKYYMDTEVLEKGKSLAKKYQDTFVKLEPEMEKLFNDFDNKVLFMGETRNEFMDTFEIAVKYHKQLNELKPQFLAVFEEEKDALEEFESSEYMSLIKRV